MDSKKKDMPFAGQASVLTDSFNRQIDYLRISITDRCNLKCIYCMSEKGVQHFDQSDILTTSEIIRIVRVACKYGVRSGASDDELESLYRRAVLSKPARHALHERTLFHPSTTPMSQIGG